MNREHQEIVDRHQAGATVDALAAAYRLSRGRVYSIIAEARKVAQAGLPRSWLALGGCGPVPATPLDRWPGEVWYSPEAAQDIRQERQDIIRYHCLGWLPQAIASHLGQRDLSYVTEVISFWSWRVLAIAHDRELWKPSDWQNQPRGNLGRPLDMGGPRDEWIERDPWSAG